MKLLFITLLILSLNQIYSKTIIVSNDTQVNSLSEAAKNAVPGDTILFKAGDYTGGNYISNLKGTFDNPIYIIAEFSDVSIKGGSNAWQISDPENIVIQGFTFEGQTSNGVNIDDGGSFDTPAKNIKIYNCVFGNIIATGNNDLLKLSGIDSLVIANCIFANASAGGSMIDMVGCHNVSIQENVFENGGSNAIQAKGATKDVYIERNYFLNCGQRAINIGGSTGLEFFRPQGANYESQNVNAYANVFVGSITPVGFVGTVNSSFINNTIIMPEKWAMRILQENTSEGFLQCSNNSFINNIIYIDKFAANPAINIGPNTMPETFTFSNNLWYNVDNPDWSGPNLPSIDENIILMNPEFVDVMFGSYSLKGSSPAIGKGFDTKYPIYDINSTLYKNPRSLGAIEFQPSSVSENNHKNYTFNYNRLENHLEIEFENICSSNRIDIIGINGDIYSSNSNLVNKYNIIDLNQLNIANQSCFIIIKDCNNLNFEKINIVK